MELIGRVNACKRAYLQYKYCKVKPRIQRELSHTIKSRCACVWNIWWIYMVAILILLCSLQHISYLKLRNNCKKTWAILFIFFFSSGHLSTHCFNTSDTCPFFLIHLSSSLFFMNNFCIAHASFLQQTFDRY